MAVFPVASEAEANASEWLEKLKSEIDYEWEWTTPTALVCEPAPGLPCRVLALITPVEGGFVPVLAFTVGTKFETRYWQGRITDENEEPLPPDIAIMKLRDILGVLVSASRVDLPS